MQLLIWALVIPILLISMLFRFVFFLGDLLWTFARALLNPANLIIFIMICAGVYYFFFAPSPPAFRL